MENKNENLLLKRIYVTPDFLRFQKGMEKMPKAI